jgi:predicted deacylase
MSKYYSLKYLLLALFVLAIGGLIFFNFSKDDVPMPVVEEIEPVTEVETKPVTEKVKNIGTSVEGRIIERYQYGEGSTTLLFVGGIHGGYEWNSTLVAYELIDEIEAGTISVPEDITLLIVPNLNPDGLFLATGLTGKFTASDIPKNDAHETGNGRFNANGVDLNRNFACKWQPKSSWRSKSVSAGTSAFSEPEALALRDLVLETNPKAVVFWHSMANAVYASECTAGVLPETMILMNSYAKASGYKAVSSFDAYPVTGDAEGWLASINIPAITVELGDRTTAEWNKNRTGVLALLELYSK